MSTEPTVDARGLVSRAFAPYHQSIEEILASTGDPTAVREAAATYRSGAAALQTVGTAIDTLSSELTTTWSGSASTSYGTARMDLGGELTQISATLNGQATGLDRIANAQAEARAGIERSQAELRRSENSMIAASGQVASSAVEPLLQKAEQAARQSLDAAVGCRYTLAKVMSEVAGQLNATASAQRAALAQRRKTQRHQAKRGPGKEGSLPPFNVDRPGPADLQLKALFNSAALPYFASKGWWNARSMFQHYLEASGEPYLLDPDNLMRDVPKFHQAVMDYLAAHRGPGRFDSGWQNINTDQVKNGQVVGQDSLDWYYAMHDWRYRITGQTVIQPSGLPSTEYTVEVYKPYLFGKPRSDINVPWTRELPNGPYTIPQDAIQHLNTVGLARNFEIYGTHSYYVYPAPQ